MESLTLSDVLVAGDDIAFRDLEGEAVLLDLGRGEYFGLNEVGTRMWTLLVEHGSLKAVHERIVSEYNVAADVAARDLLTLATKLCERGLLRRASR